MENTNQANNRQNNSNKQDSEERDEHRKNDMKGLRPDDDLDPKVTDPDEQPK